MNNKIIKSCGIDEAGRGPLAGPVVAAALILPDNSSHLDFIHDSKKLTPAARNKAYDIIINNYIYSLGSCSVLEIEKFNILEATKLAIKRAISALAETPEKILIDGNMKFEQEDWNYESVVGGDNYYKNIAGASIIAKVTRDRLMQELHEKFPAYKWSKNKGYGTKVHREAIKSFGLTPYHRRSFCKNLLD